VSVFGVVGGHGASGKNKCAAIVCRLLCVGFAALLFLRSVGCIIMVIVLVSVEVMNCRHSMTPYVFALGVRAGLRSTKLSTQH